MTGASERFGPAMLARVWAVVTSENDQSGQWSDTMLKTATGSGSMEIEEKNRDHRDININFGISFQGNRVPSLGRVDAAMRRRMVLAEYMMKREEDGLPVKLGYAQDLVNEEGPAILGRILQARARYDKDGLIIMPRWKRATDEYFASIDVKGLFFDDELRFGQLLSVSTVILYDRYVRWHRDSGYKTPPGSIHAFIRELKEHPKIREHGVIFKREVVEGRKIHMAYGMGCLEVNSNVDFPKISL